MRMWSQDFIQGTISQNLGADSVSLYNLASLSTSRTESEIQRL
jgi:hypothetical protein